MPVTINAWGFDPFYNFGPGGLPPGWTTEIVTHEIRDSSGPAFDLGNVLTEITLNDTDGNGEYGAGQGDQAVIGGETYTIISIFDTDQVVIDGQTYTVVTFLMNGPADISISLPLINGKVAPAFPGMLTRAIADQNAAQAVIPVGDVICFAAGTMIETDRGPRAVESLEVGDLVLTRDHGLQAVRWLGCAPVSRAALDAAPHLRPIRIRAGALGAGKPAADLVVSPQHRILVSSKIAARMFGTAEVLVAAKQLSGLDGIGIDADLPSVDYYHILLDHHEIVFANGAEAETLLTGPEALKTLSPASRAEIEMLFPELAAPDYAARPAYPLARGREARKLAERHQRHGRALV